jgi:hypothetical protein
MLDYLDTGNFISARDSLPLNGEVVLAICPGNQMRLVYMQGDLWRIYNPDEETDRALGTRNSVDLWMAIPSRRETIPETVVVVEAKDAVITRIGLGMHEAEIAITSIFPKVGASCDGRTINRLRVIAEYLGGNEVGG